MFDSIFNVPSCAGIDSCAGLPCKGNPDYTVKECETGLCCGRPDVHPIRNEVTLREFASEPDNPTHKCHTCGAWWLEGEVY